MLLLASPALATAQAIATPTFPTDVELLSLPQQQGLRCYPPTVRDTTNLRLVFRIGSHPTDSREMQIDFAPDRTLRSVVDLQWGRDAEDTSVMYTAAASWNDAGGTGLFVVLPMRLPAPTDSSATPTRQRILAPDEVRKAKRLGAWLVEQRCDLLDRGRR